MKLIKNRKRLFEVIEVGNDLDMVSRGYDIINALSIVINLVASILYTFDGIRETSGSILMLIEKITVAFFFIDYVLRVITAKYLHKGDSEAVAIRKYVLSFTGIVDLLSFLPYYLPVFWPGGAVAFRMIRIVRIFRLFRINYYFFFLFDYSLLCFGFFFRDRLRLTLPFFCHR